MKHVSGYEQHPSSEAECRPGWMFWIPPPDVGRRPGREPALQKKKKKDRTQGTLLALRSRTAWVELGRRGWADEFQQRILELTSHELD